MTFRLPHLVAALALHLVVLGLMLGGVQCSAKPIKPTVIEAVLLDPSRQDVAQRKREEQRRLAEDQKRREAEARRVAEQKKLAEQKKKAEAEALKKKEAEAARQKQLADRKAAEKKAADKKLADQKAAEQKKAAEAARKKEQERLDREAAARREAAEQARLEEALAREAEQREAERAAEALANDQRVAQGLQWGRELEAHIKKRYSLPPNTQSQVCQVHMQLLPDGTVKSAKVITNCGSPFVDQAVIDAVYKSSPVPLPADRAVFDPELTINFKP